MIFRGFNCEVQQNVVALRPIRGEMFIERPSLINPRSFRSETTFTWTDKPLLAYFAPKGARPFDILAGSYKHIAPLERRPFRGLHLSVEN